MSSENEISIFIEPSNEASVKKYENNDTSWSQAQKLYQNEKYPEAIRAFLRYLDLSLIGNSDSVIGKTFVFYESSAAISLKITELHILIEVPFVKIPDGGKGIAAKRKLLLLVGALNDFTIDCRNNNEIYFISKSTIAQCHPSRLFEMLRSVSELVDYYDDLFIRDFSCEGLNKENKTDYSPEEEQRLWVGFNQLKEAAKNSIEKALKENLAFAKPLFCAQLCRKIFYSLQPHGLISTLCNNFIHETNSNNDLVSLNSKADKLLEDLDKIDKENFSNSIYIGETFFTRQTIFDASHFLSDIHDGFYFSSGVREKNEHRYYTSIAFFENIVYGLLGGEEKLSLIENKHLLDTLKRVIDAPREKDAADFLHKAILSLDNIDAASSQDGADYLPENFQEDFLAQSKFAMDAMLKMREQMMNALKGEV